ncbi:MAG: signal recognition particle receptor subunit alpha, partial [Dehalococcoidia bacterium]|nr:signal recognition particle receptor subunit alpha [Dehalococcoidia bacterium]
MSKTQQAVNRSRLSFFGRVRQLFDRPQVDEEVWGELEELLILADVGIDTTQELLGQVKERAHQEKVTQGLGVLSLLQGEMVKLLQVEGESSPTPSPPEVILVVGVNGSGKTTSIAKLAHSLRQEGKRVILAAADTFRAAGIDQLQVWAQRVGAEVISQGPGADPGAVVYDAIQAAHSRKADAVILDTAGRLHIDEEMMAEVKKLKDTLRPVEMLLVVDAMTGQDGVRVAAE